MPTTLHTETELHKQLSEFYADPLGFVIFAYPWGLPGELLHFDGPDRWQVEILEQIGAEVRSRRFNGRDPVSPLRFARSSGHGII